MIWVVLAILLQPIVFELTRVASMWILYRRGRNAVSAFPMPTEEEMKKNKALQDEMVELTRKALRKAAGEDEPWKEEPPMGGA